MNEFTKDELILLQNYITEINRKYEITDEMEAIESKTQSMIDNYCEHVSTYDSSACAQICRDCGRTL